MILIQFTLVYFNIILYINVNNVFNMVLNKNIYLLNLDHLALNNRFLNQWIGKTGPMALASEEPIFNPKGIFSYGAMLKTLCTVKTQKNCCCFFFCHVHIL